jgi:hypothetical protein
MGSVNWPNLIHFDCAENEIQQIPDQLVAGIPNVCEFICWDNYLTQLPLGIMNWHNLTEINYDNNVELSPQLIRFINTHTMSNLHVYSDSQNVHRSSIQSCVKDSINAITTKTNIGLYNKQMLINIIVSDSILTCKDQLIEYLDDESIHSLLLLTFGEVLWAVMRTIELDFDIEQQKEIKLILNQEMDDAQCKCFAGRMVRVVNCLNGFSPLVKINIKDTEQISNVITLIKNQLISANAYTVSTHKELARIELELRNFDSKIIDEWIEYID